MSCKCSFTVPGLLPQYGLTVLRTADPSSALPFALYILSAEGQAVLARYGFGAPLLSR